MSNAKLWVTVKTDQVITDKAGVVVNTIPAGSPGLIHNVSDDGFIYVCFPEGHRYVPMSQLIPYPKMSIGQAWSILKMSDGHHCRRANKYQFNIKFHHSPDSKIIAEHGERAWEHYNELLSQSLRDFMGDDADSEAEGIMQLMPWAHSWEQAGRSGGWLVISYDSDRYNWETLMNEFKDLEEQVKATENEELQPEIDDVINTTMNMAMSIKYINASIEASRRSLAEWLRTDEPWEDLKEQKEEDDESNEEPSNESDYDGDDGGAVGKPVEEEDDIYQPA